MFYHLIIHGLNARGGCLAVYAEDCLQARIVFTYNLDFEQLWIKVIMNNEAVAVGVVYKPPKLSYRILQELENSIEQLRA